jgi:uncharacterized protein (DUF4213/DUF364 family)
MAGVEAIADKDLPDIKPADIKIDITPVTKLTTAQLTAVKQTWVNTSRTNDQLVTLIKQIPGKIDRINAMGNLDTSMTEKIARLKEEYAVCIIEIQARRSTAVVDVG